MYVFFTQLGSFGLLKGILSTLELETPAKWESTYIAQYACLLRYRCRNKLCYGRLLPPFPQSTRPIFVGECIRRQKPYYNLLKITSSTHCFHK